MSRYATEPTDLILDV